MTDVRADFFDAIPAERERERVEAENRRLADERKKIARDGPKLKGAKLAARLDRTWRRPPGIIGWLATVDHKEIGRRYIVTALMFLALGGVLSLLMRLQLARPDSTLIGAERYNQLFTMHGSTMMFLFAVPVMEGVAVYHHPADARHALDRLPAPQRLQLLHVSVRRADAVGRVRPQHRRRTSAGSPTRRCPARNSRPASAPTSGRR